MRPENEFETDVAFQLTGQYFMNLLQKQKSRRPRRSKFSPPKSLYPHRVQRDRRKALECAGKFDAEKQFNCIPLLWTT